MSKSERKRTMVYSNVKKKAEKKSAFEKNNTINLDDEIIIGIPRNTGKSIIKKKSGLNSNKKNGKIKSEIIRKNNKNGKKKSSEFTGCNEEGHAYKERQNEKLKEQEQSVTISVPKIQNISKPKKKSESQISNSKNKKELQKPSEFQKIQEKQKKPSSQSPLLAQEKMKRQRIKIVKKITTLFMLVIILVAGGIYFLLSPVFNIKSISVLNNNHLTDEQIISIAHININQNMFKISKKEVSKSLLSNPYIEEAKIKRVLTNKIEIIIKERVPTIMLEYGNSYVYINNQGYILEISTTMLNTPILTGYVTPLDQVKPGKRLNKEDLERLEKVLSILETANSNGIGGLITSIDIKSKRNYIITFKSEDKTVHIGAGNDLSTQMLFIKEMIDREKGIEGDFYVDMDLNTNKPVFREKV